MIICWASTGILPNVGIIINRHKKTGEVTGFFMEHRNDKLAIRLHSVINPIT